MNFKNNIFTILNNEEVESFIVWAAKDAAIKILNGFGYEHKQEISKDLTADEKYISKYMDSVNFLFFKNGIKFLHSNEITCKDLNIKNRDFNIDKKSIG